MSMNRSLKLRVRIILVIVAIANFWYWMVLPMPPLDDPGLSYENFVPWLICAALLALIAGFVEGHALIAACVVAMGKPIAFVPYALFGFANRRYETVQLR